MRDSIRMSVSSIVRNNDSKSVFVMFTDGDMSAEFELRECKLLRNNGFSQQDISQLEDYIISQKASILDIAKSVNPI